MRKTKHPVVLIVDEAHELHQRDADRLQAPDGNGGRLLGVILSVLLIGHPKLRNDLRRPMEIGYRTTTPSSRVR